MPDSACSPGADPPAARGFYAIAHRAGNNLHHLEQALAAGVDAIECDFWHANGRLALRHERKLPALPVLYDKWFIRFAFGTLSLRQLLLEVDRRADLFLDVKSSTPRAAEAVLDLYHDHESMMPRTLVSSKQWRLLDVIAEAGTEMRTFYSVGNESALESLFRRCERAHPPNGTSIRHTLLSPDVIKRLHDASIEVYAWTVNMDERARQLVQWGVDGIISDDVELLERIEERTGDR